MARTQVINIQYKTDLSSLTEGLVDNIAHAIADKALKLWQEEADNSLNKTKEAYKQGLTLEKEGNASYSVVLRGELNIRVELGSTPYDMKRFLLKGSNKKVIPLEFASRSGISSGTPSRSVVPTSVSKKVDSMHGATFPGAGKPLTKTAFTPGGGVVHAFYTLTPCVCWLAVFCWQ